MLDNKLIPFFDVAYHGFGDENDLAPLRLFARDGHEMLISYSFSKNMGLYGERVGALLIFEQDLKLQRQVERLIRSDYSNPTRHGEEIVTEVLSNHKSDWQRELSNLFDRVLEMRKGFVSGLLSKGEHRYEALLEQKGIFALLDLTPEKITSLAKDKAIYLPPNGRINLAGLNWDNLDRVIDALI